MDFASTLKIEQEDKEKTTKNEIETIIKNKPGRGVKGLCPARVIIAISKKTERSQKQFTAS